MLKEKVGGAVKGPHFSIRLLLRTSVRQTQDRERRGKSVLFQGWERLARKTSGRNDRVGFWEMIDAPWVGGMTGALQEEEAMEAKSGMNLHWEPAVSLQGSCPAGGVEGETQQTWLEPQGGSSTPGEGQGKAGGQGAMLRDHLEACDQGSLVEGLD